MSTAVTRLSDGEINSALEDELRFLFGKGSWPMNKEGIIAPSEIENLYERIGLANYVPLEEVFLAAQHQLLVWEPHLHKKHETEAREQQGAIQEALERLSRGKRDYDRNLRNGLAINGKEPTWQAAPKNALLASRAARDYYLIETFDAFLSHKVRACMDMLDDFIDTGIIFPYFNNSIKINHPECCGGNKETLPALSADVRYGSRSAPLPALYAHTLFAHGSRAMTTLWIRQYFPDNKSFETDLEESVIRTIYQQLRLPCEEINTPLDRTS